MKRTSIALTIFLYLLVVSSSNIFGAADAPFKYTGVFTRAIYDQEKILGDLNCDEEHDRPIIEGHLLANKRACVEKYVDKILDQRTEWHRAREENAGEMIDALASGSADEAEDIISIPHLISPLYAKLTRLASRTGLVEAQASKVSRKTVIDSLLQSQVSSVTQSQAK
ncbi:MAG: hypothetical protein PVJ92_03330, partial [Candidatus Dependentiae bacterium]